MPRVYKLGADLLIGGRNHTKLAERVQMLLERCQVAGMTLASNKVQVGKKVSLVFTSSKGTNSMRTPKRWRQRPSFLGPRPSRS